MEEPNHSFNMFQDGTEDRLKAVEQRVEMQEDEIALLKSSMADMLRRLTEAETNHVSVRKPVPMKDHFKALPSRPSVQSTPTPRARPGRFTSPAARHRSNSTSGNNNGSSITSPDNKSNPSPGAMRRAGSTEHLVRNNKRSSFGKGAGNQRGRPSTPSHFKEAAFNMTDGSVRIYLKGRPVVLHCPTSQLDTYDIQQPSQVTDKKLKLDWVYGYRGKDCRSNLYLLPTGEMVYFVAAVVVLYNPKEDMQRHYLGHNDDVKCLAVHPDKLKIATGQVAGLDLDGREFKGRTNSNPRRPHIRVWDAVSLNTLHVIGMGVFDRSVACVSFSKRDGGTYLCATDDSNDHVLTVWDWEKENKIAETKCSKDPVLVCEFNPHSEDMRIVTCGKSHIMFWKLENGQLQKKQGLFERHEKPKFVLCIAYTSSGVVLSGDSNGNIQEWAMGDTRKINKVITGAHTGPVFSICPLRDGAFVSGGRDGCLIVWDSGHNRTQEIQIPGLDAYGGIRTIAAGTGDSLLVGTKKNSILYGSLQSGFETVIQGHVEEMWGLAAHPNKPHFLTGAYDRQIVLWDSELHKSIWSKVMDDPVQSADFYPLDGSLVAVAMATGRWLVLDASTAELVTVHSDGNEQHDVIKFSPNGRFIAIGSHDNHIYVYAVSENGRKYAKHGKCVGHSSFITHLDWSNDSSFMRSNSGDYELLYWDAQSSKQVTFTSSMRDVEWASSSCTLGFNVLGVWPEGADGTDVNSVARSHDMSLLASGDDFGKVNLYRYPCTKPKASSVQHSGHSSHVTAVKFLHDSGTLVSIGGQDCAILQWKVI